ncbi:MAG: hypothetical protein K2Y71_16930 [Xanthobacteraceae bacterium]|nr:hypothetical protein [Xanthobacteraceae bacterium]
MSEIRRRFLEWFRDSGAIFLQWLEDAFRKVANLQFHELTADEIAFFAACAVIVVLAVLKLARKPAPQK